MPLARSLAQVAVVTQRECYHGDTLGCMDASAPTVFNTGQHPWYTPRTLALDVPTVAWTDGTLRIQVGHEDEEDEVGEGGRDRWMC